MLYTETEKKKQKEGFIQYNATIAVVIPIFNTEQWLEECLESVVRQTVPFDEVILIDDGSTDRCAEICRKYTSAYPYILYIYQSNHGQATARNRGLQTLKSDYVLFLDSDDYLADNTSQKIRDYIRKHEIDVIYFDADEVVEINRRNSGESHYERKKTQSQVIVTGSRFFELVYPDDYFASASLAVYRMHLIRSVNICFPDGIVYEDNYFTFVLMNEAESVTYLPDHFYIRRYREGSTMTGSLNEKKVSDLSKCCYMIWNYMQKKRGGSFSEKWVRYAFDLAKNLISRYLQICSEGSEVSLSVTSQVKESLWFLLFVIDNEPEKNKIDFRVSFFQLTSVMLGINMADANQRLQEWEELKCWACDYYMALLKKTGFGEKGKIGVYGTGVAAEGIVELYQRLLGEIKAELVFIDSFQYSGMFHKWSVVNYRMLDESFNGVVITSYKSHEKMVECIRSMNAAISIFDPYQECPTNFYWGKEFLFRKNERMS